MGFRVATTAFRRQELSQVDDFLDLGRFLAPCSFSLLVPLVQEEVFNWSPEFLVPAELLEKPTSLTVYKETGERADVDSAEVTSVTQGTEEVRNLLQKRRSYLELELLENFREILLLAQVGVGSRAFFLTTLAVLSLRSNDSNFHQWSHGFRKELKILLILFGIHCC